MAEACFPVVALANDAASLRAKLEQAHEIIGRLTIRAETAEAALRAKEK